MDRANDLPGLTKKVCDLDLILKPLNDRGQHLGLVLLQTELLRS